MLEKLNKKSIKYKLRKRTIENLKDILGFKGEGTKDSPIVIDDLGDVTLEISVVIKGLYLILKNLTISKLLIVGSQNVVIEECFIANLELMECRSLTFRSNTILRIDQFLCRNCIYENNSILQKEYTKLINNTRERRKFFIIWIFLGGGIINTILAISSLAYASFSLASVVYLVMGVFFSIAMITLINRRYQINKIPPNRYDNFAIQELEAISNASIKIV